MVYKTTTPKRTHGNETGGDGAAMTNDDVNVYIL